MTQPIIAQLHNLTDRAGAGLTADEQQRLRDGIGHLHERAETADEAARRALAQRQEMAEERYAWQERGDRAETALARVRTARDRIAHASNVDAIWCLDQLDDALAEPAPAATQATEAGGLRARLAHTLRTTPNRHATTQLGFPDHHGPSEGYLGWCALCTRDVEALTEAVHTVMVAESPWLKATAEDLAAAEQRAARIADTLREVFATFTRVTVFGKTAFYQAEHPVAPDDMNRWRAVLDGEQPGPA